MKWLVFVAFEIEAEDEIASAGIARDMIDQRIPFPEYVATAGMQRPPCNLEPMAYLEALVESLVAENARHIQNHAAN